jgi:hypothetical protein
MKGQYVRLLLAPNTRKGTIIDVKTEHSRLQYLFHHDPRFDDRTPDFWAEEGDFEPCERPTDAEVTAINKLAKYGTR